jgi:hypothetical protein
MRATHNRLWIYLLLISYAGLNYLAMWGWWISAVCTLLILLFAYLAWRNSFIILLGVPTRPGSLLATIAGLFLFTVGSYYLQKHISHLNNLSIEPGHFFSYFHIFFYTLNEEFVLGALLLFTLKQKYPESDPLLLSIATACIFTIIHFIFFKWIFIPPNRGLLTLFTLANLLLIGVVRNNTILKYGHIGYAWSLHFGWMVILFGCKIYSVQTGKPLTEPERFNLFIGHWYLTVIITVFAILSGILLKSQNSVKPLPRFFLHSSLKCLY